MEQHTAAFKPEEYDKQIGVTIPFYPQFHQSAIDIIQTCNPSVSRWLDTGCGTGILYAYAKKVFPKTEFVLSDPSEKMLAITKGKIAGDPQVTCILSDTQSLPYNCDTFDVITAIQSHHYLDRPARKTATNHCYRMLKTDGMYITFENILPYSETGQQLALKRWETYQINRGKPKGKAGEHVGRFRSVYFPITISEHMDLLKSTGFRIIEILWVSYMQAGFYAIK